MTDRDTVSACWSTLLLWDFDRSCDWRTCRAKEHQTSENQDARRSLTCFCSCWGRGKCTLYGGALKRSPPAFDPSFSSWDIWELDRTRGGISEPQIYITGYEGNLWWCRKKEWMTDCSSQTAAFINAKIKNELLSLMAHCHSANLNLCLTVPTAALYTVIQCKTAVNTSSLGSFFRRNV